MASAKLGQAGFRTESLRPGGILRAAERRRVSLGIPQASSNLQAGVSNAARLRA